MSDWLSQQDAIDWTPYFNRGEASFYLIRFADRAISPDTGIIWCSSAACTLLRAPKMDADGNGFSLVMSWHLVTPPPPPKKPTFFQRLEKAFWDQMAFQGEMEEANAEAEMAMSQSLTDWFTNKDHEHWIGMGFDVLGVIGFGLLFVPVIGEAEMGFVAAIQAGRVALTVGRVTAGMAFGGSALGAIVDGRYLALRYDGDGNCKDEAKDWDESSLAFNMSLAAAIMVLPDFVVGGVMTLRDLNNLPSEIDKLGQDAAKSRAQSTGAANKAAVLQATKPAKANKIAAITKRAADLAKKADEANKKVQLLTNKLHAALLVNAPGTLIGTPTAEAYFGHDNNTWLGSLLSPQGGKRPSMSAGNFSAQIGSSNQTSNGQ